MTNLRRWLASNDSVAQVYRGLSPESAFAGDVRALVVAFDELRRRARVVARMRGNGVHAEAPAAGYALDCLDAAVTAADEADR